MQEAPTGAGTYRVTASLAGDNNYKSAVSQPLEFTIDKADTVLEFTCLLYTSIKIHLKKIM